MPKYSIIIPVYQTVKYLSECVDSILNQTFMDFEIILIDDGSNDGSEKMCDEYSKKDSRVISIHKSNEGQGEARNIGIKKSKGEYIVFLDSDDYWSDNNSLMKINSIIDSYDIVFFDLTFKYENKKVNLDITRNLKDTYLNGKEFMVDLLTQNSSFPWFPVLYVFKKEIWVNNKLSFPKNTFFEDQGTIYKIPLFAKKVIVLRNNIYIYRRSVEHSTTKSVNIKLLKDHINICDDIISNIKTINMSSNLLMLLLNNAACGYIDVMNHISLLKKDEYNEMIKIMTDNFFMLDYIKFGKQKYMALFIKIFGLHISSFIFAFIRKLK